MKVHELIEELKKLGNPDALVLIDIGCRVRMIEAIEAQDHTGCITDTIYLRDHGEVDGSSILSSSRHIAWQAATHKS